VRSPCSLLKLKTCKSACEGRPGIDALTYVPDIHLMTSREITSGFDSWWRGHPAWLCVVQISLSNTGLLTVSRNSRWRPPPSWTFKLCEFGTFRHVSSEVLKLCTEFGSNISYTLWDRRPFVPNIDLMTSRELTSGYDFWSCRHLWIAMTHLYTKFGAKTYIQTEVIDIFSKLKMAAAAILDFTLREFGTFRSVDSLVLDGPIYQI